MRIALTLGAVTRVSLAVIACCGMLALIAAPATANEPPLPEEVAAYFSSDLIPRLADLYGPSADGESGIDFDEATTVIGDVSRVMVWTEDFRAGAQTDRAVELSNTWVAAISRVDGEAAASEAEESDDASEVAEEPLGLATVWISPYTNLPELANFVPSDTLGAALAEAPEGSMLVHDAEYDAWFALNGDQLTPLAHGASDVSGTAMALSDAQKTLWQQLETLPPRTNQGFVVAGLTLAFVVLLLAAFVLVPDRRRSVLDPEVALGFSPRNADRD